jgi:hypothetical protein
MFKKVIEKFETKFIEKSGKSEICNKNNDIKYKTMG